jgi:hypothetical protein
MNAKKLREEVKKSSGLNKLEEALLLFDEYEKTKSQETLDRAIKISQVLCTSSVLPAKDKFAIYLTIFQHESIDCKNFCNDILSLWRDGLRFQKGLDSDNTIILLSEIIKCDKISSHDRIYTAVHLYNLGFLNICYDLFTVIACNKLIELNHRLEAVRFLYAAGDDEDESIERQTSQEVLIEIIEDQNIDCEVRYKAIMAFNSKSGIATLLNTKKLKIPYDEDFVYSLQIVFFQNRQNNIRHRILSGQNLLQMKVVTTEIRREIINELFSILNNEQFEENCRADAGDVIMRLGSAKEKIEARKIITKMGYSADGTKRKIIGPKILYDNSQNIHDETIEKHIESFLEKILQENVSQNYTLEKVSSEVSSLIRDTPNIDSFKRNAAYRAINRISIDTATFTSFNATMSEIMIHVWAKIHCGYDKETTELMEKMFVDELTEMDDNCSSGYSGRFVNVLSVVDDSLRISWEDQIKSNVSGRMNKKIRDCSDKNIQMAVAMGMIEDADPEDREIYLKFASTTFEEVAQELFKEFVEEGYLKKEEFVGYIEKCRKEWLMIK